MVSASIETPSQVPVGAAWSAAIERQVGAIAVRHRAARGSMRVLVGGGPLAAEAFLRARAMVVLAEGSPPERRAHALRPRDEEGLPAPRRPGAAELVLVPQADGVRLDTLMAAVAAALAPGGAAVLGLGGEAAGRAIETAGAAGLRVVERVPTPAGIVAIVVEDPRPSVPLPPGLEEIDRTTCIDRERVIEAATRAPWTGPQSSMVSVAELLAALADRLRAGEVDPASLPWPALPSPSGEAPGCDLLAVMPHPDDESIYVGGTLAGLSAAGQRVHLLTVTDGAGGRGGKSLASVRRRELQDAAEALGVESVRVLGWSDFGKYRDAARTEPVTAADALRKWGLEPALLELVTELRRERPRRVLGLDPQVDPNLSLHGHHLGLGLLLAVAVHAAADPSFAPHAGPAWAIDEHRVAAPPCHARWSEPFEIDREAKRRALRAHASQRYSTARVIEGLDDPSRPAIEHTRRLQGRGTSPWILVRRSSGAPIDAGIDWRSEAARIATRPRPRAAVVELLRRQAGPQLSSATERSLQRLAREGSVAVVTGQQVGLLGGAAYTLAKALSAVALARRLQREGVEAVPIFWLASQDHDLEEVQRVPRLDAPALDLGLTSDGRPVGRRELGEGIEALWRRFAADLPPPHDEAWLEQVRSACSPSSTFSAAFVAVLRLATRDTGLLILDPDDDAFARLARPLLHRAACEAEAVGHALDRARARIHAQGRREVIPTRRGASLLFALDDAGARRRLARAELDPERIGERLDREPRALSPAALLRPVVQDLVLPTIAYVGGPTERRYLEQTDEIYAWADVPQPRRIARASLLPVSTADLRALAPAGDLASLRASTQPLTRIARAGLPPAARTWLERIEVVIDELHAPAATTHRPVARVEPEAEALRELPRLQQTWPRWRRALERRALALASAPSLGARRRARGRLRGELLRLRRALLRDGRRLAPAAVAAWRRVGSQPAPPERRTTVVELLARGGAPLSASILAALEAELSAELVVHTGAHA